ncbi:MAG TPA: sulfotransferase [Allosphingosinicella sp.]
MPPETTLPNVARANRLLESLWRRGLLPRPVLEPEALRHAARLDTEVDGWWREPFERLLAGVREEAELNPLGQAMAWGQIVMALRARVRAATLWRAHPEILERPVRAPIIILGQMRSGTTRLQRLLACDERLAHTRTFESLDPVPRRGRRLRARGGLAMLRRFNLELARIHPTSATAPEEEFGYFSFGFGSTQFEAQWRIPSFSRWWEEADTRPLYREFRALVQTNAWARGDPPDKPHILKAPQFLQDLPAVLETFPDARPILIERNPAEVAPSSASLVWNQMRIQSDRADKGWVGPEWLRKTRLREERCRAALPSSCLRVGYGAMNRDWRGEITRIYDHLDLDLTARVERRMARYLAGARTHCGHRYGLEEFGLTGADIATPRDGP